MLANWRSVASKKSREQVEKVRINAFRKICFLFSSSCCCLVLALFAGRSTFAQNSPPQDVRIRGLRSSQQYLLGDWGGKRSELADKGIKFDFFYIADLQANPVGGLEQTRAG